jgi:hypothetical protein
MGVDQPSGANSVSPDAELALGTNSASPEPDHGYLLPCKSHGRPLLQLWHMSSNLRMGLVVTSDGPLPCPSPVLPSISVTEDAPTSSDTMELTHPLRSFFPMLSTVSTTTVWATPCQGARVRDRALGLGSQQEPSRHNSTTKYKTIPPTIPSTGYEDIPSQCAANSHPPGSSP